MSVTDDNVLQDVNETTYDYEINTVPKAYTYYKWEITANHGAYSFQVSEFSLKAFVCSSGNHPRSLKHLETKESTCTEHGIAQNCYYCYACGKYYSDENGTNELEKSAVILPLTSSHNYVDGVCTICGKIKRLNNAGTEADPYLIDSPQALEWFRDWVNGTYTPDGGTAETHPEAWAKLTADIDMSTICHPADKANDKEELSWAPISDNNIKWRGSFDGGGQTISNLYINSTSQYAGLFGYVGDDNKEGYNIEMKDIKFSNVNVTCAESYSGTLAGFIGKNTTVNRISVENGTINGKNILGGIVGRASYSVISNCINKVNLKVSLQRVGGICGHASNSTIEECANYGTIEAGAGDAGGIIGIIRNSNEIKNCANYGDIIGCQNIGGIIGSVGLIYPDDNYVSLLFSCGNMTCDTRGGMLFGYVIGDLHINGTTIYCSDASRTLGGSPVETVAIGEKKQYDSDVHNETNCKGYNTNVINSGIVTWLLQNGNENEIWGQDLSEEAKEPYPVLGSKKVYPVGDVHFDCSNTIILGGSFSNTDSGGKYTNIPYRDYHEFGSDGLCIKCGYAAPEVTDGDNSIPVKAVSTSGTLDNQMGYTIYKYVATSDGTLWDADFTLLASNDNKCVGETNFFTSYDVVKGTTYFIGIREKSGAAVDGTCSLEIAGAWSPDDGLKKPIDLLGIGTQESPFELKNAKHLLWFSHYVNGTYEPETGATASLHPEACANMVADIDLSSVCHPADAENSVEEVSWIPICKNYGASWYGTFDGGGHTISNLYYKGTDLTGLFGHIQGEQNKPGTIKDIVFTNVSIDNYNSGADAGTVAGSAVYINISGIFVESGSIAGGNDAGGIVGNYGYGIISNCSNKINITSKRSDAGGICGKYAGSREYIISNCANYGNISGSEDAGGIVGFTYWTSTIKDVFSSGDVTISTSGRKSFGLIVGLNRDKLIFDGVIAFNKEATLKNSVDGIIEGKAVGEISDGATLTGENIPQGFTKDQKNSGYLTYVIMNNGKTDGTQAWYQNIDKGTTDAYPVLDNTHGTVYQCTPCTGVYSNTEGVTAKHSYPIEFDSNGFRICPLCGATEYQPATQNESGKYEIGNAGQLYWFAGLVNGTLGGVTRNKSANAVLTYNITVNEGVLDTNGKPNSGAFRNWTPIGIFDSSDTGYSGTFDGNNKTISGLYFNDTNTSFVGLFGDLSGTVKNVGVVDSYFNGKAYVGGVCGSTRRGTIQNCYNTATVNGTEYVGGVCGYNIGNSSIINCYNVGAVSGDSYVGGVCGLNSSSTITNCYYLSGTATGGINGADATGSAESKSLTQFASGEVAYLLNEGKAFGTQVWGQHLGVNDYPVLGSDYKVIRAAKGDMDANSDYPYWATFSNQSGDSDLGGLNVYTAKVSEGVLTITRCSDKIVAVNEGVLVKGSAKYLNAKMLNTNSATPEANNDLVATPDETEVIVAKSGHKLYRLTYNTVSTEEALGFYWGIVIEDGQVRSDDGSQLKATPNKAYLDVTTAAATGPFSAAPACGFVFPSDDGETTGIECISVTKEKLHRNVNAEGIFDLQGRKVSKPTKGVYINNGKKVIIK